MPHRETRPQTRCDRCDEPASGRCVRCDRPLCEGHEPALERRCDRCEIELERRVALATRKARSLRESLLSKIGLPILISLALFGFAMAGVFELAAGLLLTAGLVGSIWADLESRKNYPTIARAVRRKFLRERPGQRLLGSAPEEEE